MEKNKTKKPNATKKGGSKTSSTTKKASTVKRSATETSSSTKKNQPRTNTTKRSSEETKSIIEQEIIENDNATKKRINKKTNKKPIILFAALAILVLIVIFIVSNMHKDIATIALETHVNEVSQWEYKIGDKSIVKHIDKKQSGDLEGKTQEGLIIEKHIFQALKPGKTTIKFTFINTVNKSYGEIKEYKVTVDENLKLEIKEA